MSSVLCKLGWHGGLLKQQSHCVGFGNRWAVMECSKCGARHIWKRGYLNEDTLLKLKERHERGPQE